jgi:hypothetical protein
MFTSEAERRALARAAELEAPLTTLEAQLDALGQALRDQDAQAVERVAGELHAALSCAVDQFSRAARGGAVPLPLRQRLAAAGGQVAAQREALARATASLDRALDVLMPPTPEAAGGGFYGAAGSADRPTGRGSLIA